MAKSPRDCEFDALLLEAWERCSDDEDLRASAAYCCARRLLDEVTRNGVRGPAELERLRRVVDALRSRDYAWLCRPPCPEPFGGGGGGCGGPRRPAPSARDAAQCALLDALAAYDERSGLPAFYGRVAALTCDRGDRLRRVTDAALSDFRRAAHAMLADRVARTGAALARELALSRGRFSGLTRRAINRAQLAVARVRELMPAFDWRRYAAESDYMRLVAVRPSPGCVTRADGADETDDARGKRLLYRLDWLRSEADRAEAENRCLYEQRTGLAAELAAVRRDAAREQADAAACAGRMARELDELRAKSTDQVCAIDRLMAAVQQSAQGKRDGDADADGACAKAGDPSPS